MTLTEIEKKNLPVLLHFFKEGCSACRLMSKILQSIVAENSDDIELVKLNIGETSDWVTHFSITNAPETLILSRGKIVFRQFGVIKAAELQQAIIDHSGK